MTGCLFLMFSSWQVHIESDLTYQGTHTSVTWLSPVIRWWTVCPSMVVICWIYVLSSWYRNVWVKLKYNIYKKKHCSTLDVQYLICWFLSYNDVFLSQGLQPLWGDWCLVCLQGCETCKAEVGEFRDFFCFLCSWHIFRVPLMINSIASVISSFLTLQCGQGFFVTVDYDGLLWCGSVILLSQIFLIVETFHVKF